MPENNFEHACHALDRCQWSLALALFLRGVAVGETGCHVNLGVMFHDGLGMPRSYRRAQRSYMKSLQDSTGCAENNLACLRRDQGLHRLAEHWFQRAIQQGNTDAWLELAKLHLQHDRIRQAQACLLQVTSAAPMQVTHGSREEADTLLHQLSQSRRSHR